MSKIPRLIIDGPIGEPDAFLQLEGITTSISASTVGDWLAENKSAKEIEVEIRSNGGSVTQGFMIHDMLINSGKKITTVGYNVKSIATVIFMAGSVRKMAQNGEFLIHNPWIDPFSLGFGGLDADSLQQMADDMKSEEDRLVNFYKSKLALDEVKAGELRTIMDRDSNMAVDDVLSWGFATEVMTETTAKSKLEVYAYSDKVKSIIKAKNMAENKKKAEAKSAFGGILNGLKKLAKDAGIIEVKAAETETSDGVIYHDGELAVDTAVFTDAEMTTPVGDGEVTLVDGRVITVAGGIVTAIVESDSEQEAVAALKIANLRLINEAKVKDAKIKTLEAENKTIKEAQAETKSQVEALSAQIKEFETNYFNDEESDPKTPGIQNFKGTGKQTPHKADGLKRMAAKQYGN